MAQSEKMNHVRETVRGGGDFIKANAPRIALSHHRAKNPLSIVRAAVRVALPEHVGSDCEATAALCAGEASGPSGTDLRSDERVRVLFTDFEWSRHLARRRQRQGSITSGGHLDLVLRCRTATRSVRSVPGDCQLAKLTVVFRHCRCDRKCRGSEGDVFGSAPWRPRDARSRGLAAVPLTRNGLHGEAHRGSVGNLEL